MASNTAAGKKQFNQALDANLVTEWIAWVEQQPGGLNSSQHLEMAMRRHMKYPPALPYAPPMPSEVTAGEMPSPPSKPRGRPKKA